MASSAGLDMNLARLTRSLSALPSTVSSAAEENMQVATLHLEGEIRKRAPVDTGHLRASYESRVDREGGTIVGRVGTNVPYAPAQEYLGTPHIRPALDAEKDRLIQMMAAQTVTDAVSHVT